MPSVTELRDRIGDLFRQRQARRDHQEKLMALLPVDLSEYVYNRAREEAQKVQNWRDALQAECERVRGQIQEEERRVRAMCPKQKDLPRMKGKRGTLSVLFDWELVPGKEHADRYQLTEEALNYRKEHVQPLRARLSALEAEDARAEQELFQLARIADHAFRDEIDLIHHLSDVWRSRLEIGVGVQGTMARLVSYRAVASDPLGNELPIEALDANGRADVPQQRGPRA